MIAQTYHPDTNTARILDRVFTDPNTKSTFKPAKIRENTLKLLEFFKFSDDAGNVIRWTQGQLEIIDTIVNRGSIDGNNRIEIIASTQYGKSLAVAAGIIIRACMMPEMWAIVAGTTEKARIIMEYVVMLSLNSEIVRTQLTADTPMDRLRMKKSADRLTFKKLGQVRVFSADSSRVNETSKALMGFGSPNVIEDESGLIGDILQATVMRMLGGYAASEKGNFLIKIGNPFNRNHFHRTWMAGKYHRIFIDYNRALAEGRYSESFVEEMKQEAMFDILYGCMFPDADMIDSKGWMPLLTEEDIKRAFVKAEPIFGNYRLGADVAGGGRNYSTMTLRGYNVAKLIYKESVPDTMMFTGQIQQVATNMQVKDGDIFVDMVGIGKGLYDRLREMNKGVGVNAGFEATDKVRFSNKRAEMFWRTREWLTKGGKLEQHDDWMQLAQIKYKVDSSGRIVIMSKEEMLRNGVESPDVADSLAFTFYTSEEPAALGYRAGIDPQMDISTLDPFR